MVNWKGTFLSAAFLAPKDFRSNLSKVLIGWSESELLVGGRARWLDLAPDDITYEVMLEERAVFESDWPTNRVDLERLVDHATLLQAVFPIRWAHGDGQVMLDLMVHQDDSISLSLNAPYDDVYVDRLVPDARENLERFVHLACSMFMPEHFLVGHIGEEARFEGVRSVLSTSALPHDWALYGNDVVHRLRGAGDLAFGASTRREIPEGGLFVQWTNWDESETSPHAWRRILGEVAHQLELDFRTTSRL
jgi:hypothetical protein